MLSTELVILDLVTIIGVSTAFVVTIFVIGLAIMNRR